MLVQDLCEARGFGGLFDPERARLVVAFRIKLEDEADEFGFCRINLKLLLVLGTALLSHIGAIAQRRW